MVIHQEYFQICLLEMVEFVTKLHKIFPQKVSSINPSSMFPIPYHYYLLPYFPSLTIINKNFQ